MAQDPQRQGVFRFGVFELDPRAGELRKNGVKLRLQEQPLQVLLMLLERPGDVVTREELQERLWPDGTFVDFDKGVNTAIQKLREVLDDSATTPRFVETVPRRGYRFIYPIEAGAPLKVAVSTRQAVPSSPAGADKAQPQTGPLTGKRLAWLGGLVAAVALVVSLTWSYRRDAGASLPGSSSPETPSVAVLPLQNISGDPGQEFFSDGMTDALISDLGMIEGLRVISRHSSMRYKNVEKSLADVARELNVNYVVEGSVLLVGDRVRITAHLSDAVNDQQLWSRSYEGERKGVLGLQGQVARAIAAEVRVRLRPALESRLASERPVDPDAHLAYLRGVFYLDQVTTEGTRNAIDNLEQSINIDPNFAPAYVGLSEAYERLGWGFGGPRPKEVWLLAKNAALKAIELDDALADAYAQLGDLLRYEWDWIGAERSVKRAIELNPSLAHAHWSYAYSLMATGQVAQALQESGRARELDPLSLQGNILLAHQLLKARHYDSSIEESSRTIETYPNSFLIYMVLGRAYLAKGLYEDAAAQLQQAVSLAEEDLRPKAWLGYAHALTDKQSEARRILQELVDQAKQRYVLPDLMALIHTGLGENEKALDRLAEALEDRSPHLIGLKVEFQWDPLRSHSRFQAFLEEMNLAD